MFGTVVILPWSILYIFIYHNLVQIFNNRFFLCLNYEGMPTLPQGQV